MTFEQFISMHIRCDVTKIVRPLAFAFKNKLILGDASLHQQAAALCAPILDYETPAREQGWRRGSKVLSYESAKDFCDHEDISPISRQPVEFWAVSKASEPDWEATAAANNINYFPMSRTWQRFADINLYESAQDACEHLQISPSLKPAMAEWLLNKGERVLPFGDLMVWARVENRPDSELVGDDGVPISPPILRAIYEENRPRAGLMAFDA